ncbi:hypothetical protein [Citreimonas sp.]|uniref:hypothetical protein n=1 Tax=Citreimonas sp. TaxID=3036715 RepID=UPI0040598AC5
MFAPEGFSSFYRFADNAKYLSETIFDPSEIDFSVQDSDRVVTRDDIIATQRVFTSYQINTALVRQPFPIFICSPAGHLMQAEPPFFRTNDPMSLYDWRDDVPKDDELGPRIFGAPGEKNVSLANDLYWFLDESCFVITSNRSELDRSGGLENALSDGFCRHEAYVKPFHGWSVCYRESDVPENVDAYLDLIGCYDAFDHWFEDEPVTRMGRPNERKKAAELYRMEFGDAHDCTWEEVERRIGYSKRTIQRGLKEH